jgi:hypothetical protein
MPSRPGSATLRVAEYRRVVQALAAGARQFVFPQRRLCTTTESRTSQATAPPLRSAGWSELARMDGVNRF